MKDIFYINLHLKDRLDTEFTVWWGELTPQEALTSFTVSDAYRHFDGQAQLMRPESRSRIEYLIPRNNIIVLDSYLSWRINLISFTGFDTI